MLSECSIKTCMVVIQQDVGKLPGKYILPGKIFCAHEQLQITGK